MGIRHHFRHFCVMSVLGILALMCGSLESLDASYDATHDSTRLGHIRNMIGSAIIGAGPSGLAASIATTRGDVPTAVFMGPQWGGQLMQSNLVENVPGFGRQTGKKIMQTLRKQAADFGVQLVPEQVVSVDLSTWPFMLQLANGDVVRALTVIIAAGSKPKLLGVKGEAQFYGNGVSTCAICDAGFFEGLEVGVVGGGDSAVIQALLLSSHARAVTIWVRSNKMRAAPMVRRLLDSANNVTIKMNKKVVEICGDTEGLTHVVIEDSQTGNSKPVNVDGVFLAIGHLPSTELFKPYLPITQEGFLVTKGRSQATSIPGIFACGECVQQDPMYRQVIVAEGDGTKAGIDAVMYLQNAGIMPFIKRLSLYKYAGFNNTQTTPEKSSNNTQSYPLK